MKIIAPLLLLAACSAEGRPDAAANAARAAALASANQTPGVIVTPKRSDPRGAAAKIMAGGFLGRPQSAASGTTLLWTGGGFVEVAPLR